MGSVLPSHHAVARSTRSWEKHYVDQPDVLRYLQKNIDTTKQPKNRTMLRRVQDHIKKKEIRDALAVVETAVDRAAPAKSVALCGEFVVRFYAKVKALADHSEGRHHLVARIDELADRVGDKIKLFLQEKAEAASALSSAVRSAASSCVPSGSRSPVSSRRSSVSLPPENVDDRAPIQYLKEFKDRIAKLWWATTASDAGSGSSRRSAGDSASDDGWSIIDPADM